MGSRIFRVPFSPPRCVVEPLWFPKIRSDPVEAGIRASLLTAPIVFNGMTVSTSVLTLTNPIYAGYAFGRTTSRVSVENGRKRVRRGVHRPMAEFAGNFGTWFAHFVVLAQNQKIK
jgi:hypothetical protein